MRYHFGSYTSQPVFLSRASTGTYIDGGVLKYAEIDEARYQDGVLLIEDEAINNLTFSEDYTNSDWTKTNATVTTDGTTTPDGVKEAFLITQTAAGGSISNRNIPFSGRVTSSVYIKQGSSNIVDIYTLFVGTATKTNAARYIFDTEASNIQRDDTGNSVVTHEVIGDGWVRINFSSEDNGGNTTVRQYIYGGTATTTTTVYATFSQMENNTNGTSYIPTEAIAANRAKDIVTY